MKWHLFLFFVLIVAVGCIQTAGEQKPETVSTTAVTSDLNEIKETTEIKPGQDIQTKQTASTGVFSSPAGFAANGLDFSIDYPLDWNVSQFSKSYDNSDFVKKLMTIASEFAASPATFFVDYPGQPYPFYTARIDLLIFSGSDFNVLFPERLNLYQVEDIIVSNPSWVSGTSVKMDAKIIDVRSIMLNENTANEHPALYVHKRFADGSNVIQVYVIPGTLVGQNEKKADAYYVFHYLSQSSQENFEKYKADALKIIKSFKIIK